VLDFRYHALSLVAVFLALLLGLLLGIAIGDSELVSSAESDLREDLRGDVLEAREGQRDLADELQQHRTFELQAFPLLVGDRLQDRRIAVLLLNAGGNRTFDDVRSAIAPSGGELVSVTRLRLPPDLDALGRAAAGTRFEVLPTQPELLEPFARRVGEQLVQGGRLLEQSRDALFASSSGEVGGAEAVVVIRGEPPASDETDEEARALEETLVSGLFDGVESFRIPAVGVERTDAEESQIPWYQSHGLASVDNVDQVAGRTALVLALTIGADGAYGVKATRDALLPEAALQP
jgi:hypothetical protein